ncbi:hypothetical protein GCM10010420_09180 [Streptomyces glaucosporus]|uniref:Uncharacterized protein n=1 Tax=Streptomyces glaucosporus TaxID=284044 RepID=A0ABN3HVH3_9ACTN
MLTSLSIGWLWLLAAASTALSSGALGSWIPLRKFRIAYPVIMVACGVGLVAFCRLNGFSPAEALVMYSSAHIGLTLGMLPMRKLFREGFERWRRGELTEPIEVPRRYLVFFAVSLVLVSLAGFALTR